MTLHASLMFSTSTHTVKVGSHGGRPANQLGAQSTGGHFQGMKLQTSTGQSLLHEVRTKCSW